MKNEATKITEELTIREIMAIPELKEYGVFLLYSPNRFPQELQKTPYGDLKLSEIPTRHPTWNGRTMTLGLNRILELEKMGKKLKYNIWNDDEIKKNPEKKNSVVFHFPGDEGKPFVIVCAGGAYMSVCSMVEAFPVAKQLNDGGYTAFVLNYRVSKDGVFVEANEDLTQTVSFILSNAEEFNVSKENYAVAGFSAGAHLTATLGTDNYGYKKSGLPKPAALFLGYPLISTDNIFENNEKEKFYVTMAGENYTQEILDGFSISKNMSSEYPATYIWMCKDDDVVPFSNSVIMAEKLEKLGIPYIHKIVEHGGHGLGLALETGAEGWLKEAVSFWENNQ